MFPLVVAIIAAIWLKETLPPPSDPTTENDTSKDVSYKDLLTPKINILMISFAILSLLGSAHTALQPLFTFTPVRDGGLGFSEKEIGISISIRSVMTIVIQVAAFPSLQRKVGTRRLYKWLMILWLPTYLGLPLVNVLARRGWSVGVWTGLSATLLFSAIANMAFGEHLLPLESGTDDSVQLAHDQRRGSFPSDAGGYQW